ncbi:MAG: aminotransferase class V-fold PLP-dependent enzyme [Clostridia bacterium]|nr:aminotransferase class V-fold PLP-dependent enzyme [Clostridia bacterium]
MLHFDSDYMEGCHPEILKKLAEINMDKNTGYGTDAYCESAKEKILTACGLNEGEVYFLTGGTQTNAAVISAVLKKYEGVIAADSGHISVHEAGAVEYTGHKVLVIPNKEGKIEAEALKKYLLNFHNDCNNAHMVYPGMVYISFPTEYGTLYSARELKDIHSVCREYNIPLFIDGARLGYGLMSAESDVTLEYISHNCDIFYIGGTKAGAMFGEAVVIPRKGLIPHFFTMIKQQGALLAKGWLLGVQFDILFTNNLYFNIAKNAVSIADKMKKIFIDKGYRLYINSPTNQIFVILPDDKIKELSSKVSFGFWERYDESSAVVRFAVSWAASEDYIKKLSELL